MTLKMRVLRVMADGKARSTKQLIEETGLPPQQVESAIRSLAYRGMADTTPVMYQLNASGMERANFQPKTRQQINAERTIRRREAGKNDPAPMKADAVVSKAKKSRCALSLAWEAMS